MNYQEKHIYLIQISSHLTASSAHIIFRSRLPFCREKVLFEKGKWEQITKEFPNIEDRITEPGPDEGMWLHRNMVNIPIDISASSTLQPSNVGDYKAKNIIDDDARTAWVEGKEDYGIGEYIEFDSYGMTDVRIYNGYQKNESSYYNNSRVKLFKVYLDDEYVGDISLNDQPGEQKIDFSSFDKDFKKVKLEIKDVYPGKKWKDVAITELFFQGG